MKYRIILLTAIIAIIASCSTKKQDQTDENRSVTLSSTQKNDTIIFKKSNGDTCNLQINITITYPASYGEKTTQLQNLYKANVLNANDSLNIEEALKQYCDRVIEQYTPMADEEDDETTIATCDNDGRQHTDFLIVNINITASYNQMGIITFCTEEAFTRNKVITSKVHSYNNLDLVNMTTIEASNIFRDDALPDITKLLKNQLLAQNNVTNTDQLIEQGYFNIDNLKVTDNFSFGDKGITWTYPPQELAINALGEPCITLDYDTLKDFAASNSVLTRFE
ncbi:MAG: DUF3298 domain-containing protein [Muribaculaceae bacterium]|nr:DUF3298 domain-containing protein [Muribaculaceae bacterium]